MQCDKLVCSLCGGSDIEEQQTVLRGKNAPIPEPGVVQVAFGAVFVCQCGNIHKEKPICNGEVKNVRKDNEIIDCVCNKCGASYGKGALARHVFREKFLVQS